VLCLFSKCIHLWTVHYFTLLPLLLLIKNNITCEYCTSFYGSVLWDLSHPLISAFCTTWRKGIRRIWGIPYCSHSSLLPVMSNYLPLLDELCCRSTAFIKSCLESDSPIVSAVAHYDVHYGRMNSHIGRNAFFCCSCYDVADISCVTRCMVSHYVDEYISPQSVCTAFTRAVVH